MPITFLRCWLHLEVSQLAFQETQLERDGIVFRLRLLDLENAVVAFFYEGPMRLGTLAFALPRLMEATATTSSILLGGKYLIITRSLAERIAVFLKKMSLVSVYTSLQEAEAFRIFLKLLDDAVSQRKSTP